MKRKNILTIGIIILIAVLAMIALYIFTPYKIRIKTNKNSYQIGEDISFTVASNKLILKNTSNPIPIIQKKVDGKFETVPIQQYQCPISTPGLPSPNKVSFLPSKYVWDQRMLVCTDDFEKKEYEATGAGIYRAMVFLTDEPGEFYSEEFEIVGK